MAKYTGKSYVALDHCPRCGRDTGVILDRRLKESFTDGERYTSGNLCDECKAEIKMFSEVMAAGGIMLMCEQCGMEAALKLSDDTREFILRVRAKTVRGDMHQACGLRFLTCAEHEAMGIAIPKEGDTQ